jgi:hypothetical protein
MKLSNISNTALNTSILYLLILELFVRIQVRGEFMGTKTKKATFNLHTDVLLALDQVVAQGAATSKNALVEQALIKELKELRKQARVEMWRDASKDKLLLKDIEDIEVEFRTADAETAPRIR